MTPPTLAQRVVAIEGALADVSHAFGGALALAYYAEPRATIDIDLNVFVPGIEFPVVARPLAALGVATEDPEVAALAARDGQVRVFWDATPLDLFFAYDAFHSAAERACRRVPFADVSIPILSADHLIVCKTVFGRAKDWVDIDAMVALDADVDAAEILRWVARITGDTDPRYERIVAVLTNRLPA